MPSNGLEFSELEIWNLFRSGNESAFNLIYQKYFDKLYNYGCQFTQDHALVEDVLQDFFIELKRRCKHLSETDKILPYLYVGFRRKIIRARDKQARFKELDNQGTQSFELAIDVSIIEEESKEENSRRLKEAMAGLNERQRETIFLFYYENLTYEEIKEIQGFENVKSARNLLYKAIKALRESFFFVLFILKILI